MGGGAAEVADLPLTFGVLEDVLELDIAMSYAICMEYFKPRYNLVHYLIHLLLLYHRPLLPLNVIKQIPILPHVYPFLHASSSKTPIF